MKKINDVIWIKSDAGDLFKNDPNIKNMKELLNQTGPGMCLAKFTQSTLHLGTGLLHSCHHPKAHKISIDDLKNNVNVLFNTSELQQARTEMLNGGKPSECDYCWRIESNNGNSDRFYKSLETWAVQSHDTIIETKQVDNLYPTYLEVDFSNVCNFSCLYCGPEFSSKWVETLKSHGPTKVLENTKYEQWIQGWQDLDRLAYKNKEVNPYVDAFWEWFPEAYKNLKTYRITGGEPLLSKETFKSMDWFIDNPNTELEFSINTNLCAPEKLWKDFVKRLKKITSGNYIKKFTLFTSIDGWGKRAEYSRVGLDFELFKKRYEEIAALRTVRLVIMCTFNIFSVTSIKDLFEWYVSMCQKYNPDKQLAKWEAEFDIDLGKHTKKLNNTFQYHSYLGFDIPYLRFPECLDVHHADKNLIENYLIPAIEYMGKHSSTAWAHHQGFEPFEFEKFKRIVIDVLHYQKNHKVHEREIVNRAKFFDFVNDADRRHGTNFLEVFPEMTKFYKESEKYKKILTDNKEWTNKK
jgi:organic radical activating enzyme